MNKLFFSRSTAGAAGAVTGSRPITAEDIPALGELFFHSHVGTPDALEKDVAEATAEMRETFEGKHGEVISEACLVVEDQGHLVCAVIVSRWRHLLFPLLAYVFTAQSHTRRGLASQLIQEAMMRLHRMGEPRLCLFVTDVNPSAIQMYHKMGFEPSDWKAYQRKG